MANSNDLTLRAAAWYTAAYRRLARAELDWSGGSANDDAAYEARASIGARYARQASAAAAISRNIRESKPAGYTR